MLSGIQLSEIAGSDLVLRATLVEAALPTDDIEDEGRTFFRASSNEGEIYGFSGIERCASDALLRSIVVLPSHRGRGIGLDIVVATLGRAGLGSDVYLATTTATAFFSRIGFVEVARDSVPSAVLATRQLSSICPSSATIMKLIKPPS